MDSEHTTKTNFSEARKLENFFDFMQKSPLKGLDLEITRDKSSSRDVMLEFDKEI